MRKIFLFLFILKILFFPLICQGKLRYYEACESVSSGVCMTPTYTVCYDGLVPCGKDVWYAQGSHPDCPTSSLPMSVTTTHCQLCHFFIMFNGAVDFLIWEIVLPLAVLMLIVGGILYILAILEFVPGGPQTVNQAKQVISAVFIGLFIVFSAWFLVNLFFTLIGVADWTGLKEGWFKIDCPVEL